MPKVDRFVRQAVGFLASGLTGAVASARFAGATAAAAPVAGTFAVGDFVIDQSGALLVCIVAGTPGVWVSASAKSFMGTGNDGALTLDGTVAAAAGMTKVGNAYTMTRDVYATDITIGDAGGTAASLITGGYRLFATGTAWVRTSAKIAWNGNAAAGQTPGTVLVGGTLSPGGAGGGGGAATGAGGANGAAVTVALGGSGGVGGISGAGQAGGTNNLYSLAASAGVPRDAITALLMCPQTTYVRFYGGQGGSGGGAAAASAGGGGGSGAGTLMIAARRIVLDGGIEAIGGGGAAGTGVAAGGGGGGGGGGIVLVYGVKTGAGALTVTGGAGGAKVGTGVAGAAGSAGTTWLVPV